MFSESAELYDAIYATFKDYAKEAAQVAALLRDLNPTCHTVLDVACGTGEHIRRLVEVHGFEADGIDLDPRLLAIAARKCTASRFWEADMARFAVPVRYDAVMCLFSSIGYVRTIPRLVDALRSFRCHLQPAGLIVVEPWFPPGVLDPGIEMRNEVTIGDLRVERVSHVEIAGRLSRIRFDYRLEDAAGVRTATEVHELGLFTPAEMVAAFEAAGLVVRHDPIGLDGRGLYIGSVAARCAVSELPKDHATREPTSSSKRCGTE